MPKPKIKFSILMPVFNEEKYIVEAIESVLAQSEDNFELIIINDGSQDNTQIICKSFIDIDSRVKLLNPGKVGKTEAFNIGYRHSVGEWIIFLAGDDIIPKYSLESRYKYIEAIDSSKTLIGGYGQLLTFSDDTRFNNVKMPKKGDNGYACGGTLFLSRALSEEIFPIPSNLPNEDLWTSLFISFRSTEVINVPEVVINYRIHPGNSASRSETFTIKHESIHKRFMAYGEFLNLNKNKLDINDKKKLEAFVTAENYRYKKSVMGILFLKNFSLFNKLKFCSYANQYLYYLRMRFFKLFSGWEN